jgi:Lanthionine synthetase C-like protein
VLVALESDGLEEAVARLVDLAEDDGWPQRLTGPPSFSSAAARINDATLGTAGVLLGGLWARRCGVPDGESLAERAAELLIGEAEVLPTGLNWSFVSRRFRLTAGVDMPNFSRGLAGIATALVVAGIELERPAWIAAARHGAEHLVTLADTSGGGFRVPHYLPGIEGDEDRFAHGWCHGGTGTSLLFVALDRAGVDSLSNASPLDWHARCLQAVRTSGLPARLHPGFWDNDGRCCGTAGVGDAFLDSWQRAGNSEDLEFAVRLADVLVERAITTGPHAWWRFTEHRAAEPLLPPGVGWMQGAAGIAAYLFRINRISKQGRGADSVPRLDNWWALPPSTD